MKTKESIKDYAESRGVTYQSIYQMIQRHNDQLQEHLIKIGRTTYLDDYAIKYLDEKRNKQGIIIQNIENKEEITKLEKEKEELQDKITSLLEQYAEVQTEFRLADGKRIKAETTAEEQKKLIDELKKQNNQLTERISTNDKTISDLTEQSKKLTELIQSMQDKEEQQRQRKGFLYRLLHRNKQD